MRRRAVTLVVVAALGAACTGPGSILDAGPRVPDDRGVVTDISFSSVTLDGERSYTITSEVESFATRSHGVKSLLTWQDKYVHVGLDEDTATWIAGIGVVVKAEPPVVRYTGVLEEASGGRAVFEDGTVLELAPGVSAPTAGRETLATIDPTRHVVTSLVAQ